MRSPRSIHARATLALFSAALGMAACASDSPLASSAAPDPLTSARGTAPWVGVTSGTSTTGISYLPARTGTLIDMLENGWVVGSTQDDVPVLSAVMVNVRTGEREVVATFAPALTHAKAINGRREVVGGNPATQSFPEARAFHWYRGTRTDYGAGAATDINEAGTFVGYGYAGQAESGIRLPWVVEGGAQRFLDVQRGRAMGINNRRDIVGMAMDPATAWIEAPVAWMDGRLTVLVSAVGEASDINERRQVVGWATREDPTPHLEAFLWEQGRLTWLGTLVPSSAGGYSEAHAINERGQVAGRALASDGLVHAVAWYKGRMLDLGLATGLPDVVASEAYGITNSGAVLGRSFHGGTRFGIIWNLPAD